MKNAKLNKYEKRIEENIMQYRPVSAKTRTKIEHIIKRAKEKKNISLRVNGQDLNLLKLHAEQEGIPYQTYISSILHKFVTEQLVEEKNIVRSIKLLKSSS
ncbi:MAG: antitoxin [Candidatus Ratteibacteria bacterium]|nr:antitoxin [Candidatus Ratteibacteria bacterium]